MVVDIESGEETVQPSDELAIYDLQTLKQLKLFYVQRDYITAGYRGCPKVTIYECTKTLFKIHNETTNVWSHLIPAFYFTYQLLMLIFGPT